MINWEQYGMAPSLHVMYVLILLLVDSDRKLELTA